jgi:hypothetical protein
LGHAKELLHAAAQTTGNQSFILRLIRNNKSLDWYNLPWINEVHWSPVWKPCKFIRKEAQIRNKNLNQLSTYVRSQTPLMCGRIKKGK